MMDDASKTIAESLRLASVAASEMAEAEICNEGASDNVAGSVQLTDESPLLAFFEAFGKKREEENGHFRIFGDAYVVKWRATRRWELRIEYSMYDENARHIVERSYEAIIHVLKQVDPEARINIESIL